MNKIFNIKNLYTFLFVVSIYTMFVLLFGDVLKDKEFNIGLKEIPFILVSILLFTWVSKYFFNKTEYSLPNIKIVIILGTSIVLSLFLQKFIYIQDTSDFNEKQFQNPLYKQFSKIANNHHLDLSFTKTAWIQRGPINYKINTIFNEKPKSIDILFLADSSMAWGFIPKVIEQMTGKKVAIYAYESNLLTAKASKLFHKISQYYLKENGLVIFSFENSTMIKDPQTESAIISNYDEVIQWDKEDFIKFAEQNEKSTYEKYFSFTAFQSLYKEKSEYLKTKYGLYLKSPSFYENYLEPIINPKLHFEKSVNENEKSKFIRWDMDSITLYNPEFKLRSIHSEVMPKISMNNKNVQINAEASSKIYGKNKIYMIPLYNNHNHYKQSRNIYDSYYKNLGFKLCDLGTFQPKEDAYLMQTGSHMGNTGGLMKSILIGKWLKKYFMGNTTQVSSN